jgi:hypothetical protein
MSLKLWNAFLDFALTPGHIVAFAIVSFFFSYFVGKWDYKPHR